jgi:ABC-type multidrug transport system ATPase subunit
VGTDQHIFNGLPMVPRRVYILSPGSTIKTQLGEAHYYSDLSAAFNEELKTVKLSFRADIRNFTFPGGIIGLREVQLSEGPGKLIGIMGASGAGKTTLLNVLAGLEQPTEGTVQINGFNLHEKPEELRGVVGYVAQDDMLIEELTVYENLYYNARLCFDGLSEARIQRMVIHVLQNLGLEQWRDLRVGSVLDKTISGGQRKRLNIALELIREPAVLFLDEPTSGLSSRDSENVIDLLKELSNRGKLVITVIHQPSSDIYKMFDKILIMEAGGFMAYYGPPVEAVTWFKEASSQADFNRGQCEVCGNVNPEQIFSLMEARILDEYGNPTSRRKVNPAQWNELFKENYKQSVVESVK